MTTRLFSVFLLTTASLVTLILVPTASDRAAAQSFSCANAQIPSEMAVCNNEELLIKDETVASLLATKLVDAVRSGNGADISREHANWLKERNSCLIDTGCLLQVYDQRIRKLIGRSL